MNLYLKDLLEGAVRAWNVVADVTVSDDRAEAQVTAADGVAVHITCRPGPAGDWQWHLSRLNGKTETAAESGLPLSVGDTACLAYRTGARPSGLWPGDHPAVGQSVAAGPR